MQDSPIPWDTILSAPDNEKSSACNYFISNYHSHSCVDFLGNTYPSKDTVLTLALEQKVSLEIVRNLIRIGCSVNHFHPTTVPPCLIVLKQILNHRNTQDTKDFSNELNNPLYSLIDLLVDAGACLEDSFYAGITDTYEESIA